MATSERIVPRSRTARALALGLLALVAALPISRNAAAQDVAAEAGDVEILTAPQLEELVGPIALYPDDLVAIVLPAATYPLQVVQAARFLEDRQRDSSLEPDPDWDDSVVALLNYPEVVKLMNDDLDWTWDLGEAVLRQRADVLDAIQTFRDRAQAAGNLRSDDRQIVEEDDGAIEIRPADPEVIYVPYYEPRRVVVYQPAPVYHYYPVAYPVYCYPYPLGYRFRTGHFWGVSTWFGIGWHNRYVHAYPWDYHAHPFYGWRYHDPFYVRHGVNINVNIVNIDNDRYVWRPGHRHSARPVARSDGQYVNDRRNVRGMAPGGQSGQARTSGQQQQRYRRDAAPGARTYSRPTENSGAPVARTTPRARPDASAGAATSAEGTQNADGSAVTRTTPRARPDATRSPQIATRTRPSTPSSTSNTSATRTTPGTSIARTTPRARPDASQSAQTEARRRPTAPSAQPAPSRPQPRAAEPSSQYRSGGRAISRPSAQNAAPRAEARAAPAAPRAAPAQRPAPQASAPPARQSQPQQPSGGGSQSRGNDDGGGGGRAVSRGDRGSSSSGRHTR